MPGTGTACTPCLVSSDALDDYLRHIGAIPRLDAADEVALAQQVRAGQRIRAAAGGNPNRDTDEPILRAAGEARRRLVEANLRLVVHLARTYTGRGVELLDLIQDGSIGLAGAVDTFDPARGCKFSTYAAWPIRHAIAAGIAQHGRTVRLPDHVLDHVNTVAWATVTLTDSLGHRPTTPELVAFTKLSAGAVAHAQKHASTTVSLNCLLGTDGDLDGDDLVPDMTTDPVEDRVTAAALPLELRRAFTRLTPSERTVLVLRYGLDGHDPLHYSAIADRTGLNRHRVSTMEHAALGKLRATDAGSLRDLLVG